MSAATPQLALIVAMAKNGCIGKEGNLPWHYPEDLKHFRRTTQGHAVIMGRKTYQEVGKPLPRRRNLIVTRNQDFQAPGCEVFHDLETAINAAQAEDDEPFICGGSEIYRLALPFCTRLYLTEIQQEYGGDTFFPGFPEAEFEEVKRWGEGDLVFRILERVKAAIVR